MEVHVAGDVEPVLETQGQRLPGARAHQLPRIVAGIGEQARGLPGHEDIRRGGPQRAARSPGDVAVQFEFGQGAKPRARDGPWRRRTPGARGRGEGQRERGLEQAPAADAGRRHRVPPSDLKASRAGLSITPASTSPRMTASRAGSTFFSGDRRHCAISRSL